MVYKDNIINDSEIAQTTFSYNLTFQRNSLQFIVKSYSVDVKCRCFDRGGTVNADKKQRNINIVFAKHNYIMTTAQLKEEGFYHADIVSLLDEAVIEKVKRGYYHNLQNDSGSEVLITNKLFPDVVLCMETALFYYGYTD
ncbi:MAG: type IV toxin-antitoxin system AbiEi family antitoxin domain-containing protein [Eubacteriales bacterium]